MKLCHSVCLHEISDELKKMVMSDKKLGHVIEEHYACYQGVVIQIPAL